MEGLTKVAFNEIQNMVSKNFTNEVYNQHLNSALKLQIKYTKGNLKRTS